MNDNTEKLLYNGNYRSILTQCKTIHHVHVTMHRVCPRADVKMAQSTAKTQTRNNSTCTDVGKAPQYLVDCCTSVTDVVGRQRLRLATQQLMVVPRHRLTLLATEHLMCMAPWSVTSCRTASMHSRTTSPLDRAHSCQLLKMKNRDPRKRGAKGTEGMESGG